jgi:thymidylate synthase
MYLPIPSQPDCPAAWREAARRVDAQPGHAAYNVVIDIEDPVSHSNLRDARVAVVNQFLEQYDKSVETVANTIFPAGLYYRYGAPAFFKVFDEKVLAKVRRNNRWSGYYFERMTHILGPNGKPINQLWEIVERIRDENFRALNKFELSVFDPTRDVDSSPYGGQCLSFASFKLIPGPRKTLLLTVMYRNHFYIEKLLGNLIGLGRLMDFIGREANVAVGPLTVISTHAEIDQPRGARRPDIEKLFEKFDQAEPT